MRLPLHKIINTSCVDGPGNRSVVFFQGCNFHCTYCHNPETINTCNSCGKCVSACPEQALSVVGGKVLWNPSKCSNCDTCITVCPHSASPKIRMLTIDEIADMVEENLPFIRGVTFSGGECMLQAEPLAALCERLANSVGSVLLDSNGSIDFSQQEQLLNSCDGVMLDVKCFDETKHIALTGMSNRSVLKNAEFLAKIGKLAEVRTVVIPTYLPNENTVARTAELVANALPENTVIPYKLIRFRSNGVRGEATSYRSPSNQEMETLRKIVASYSCFTPVVV